MPNRDSIKWFKEQFGAKIEPALVGTPLTLDLIVAIACQETGFLWGSLRKKNLSTEKILALCVGDTIDGNGDKGRKPFPRNKADLLSHPQGAEMFAIGRQAFIDLAAQMRGLQSEADKPHKFPRGYGLFQRDLQAFKEDPQYFLQRRYEHFDNTFARCVAALKAALVKLDLQDRTAISDEEGAALGIVYNTGGFKPHLGLKQGHQVGDKRYGELVLEFIRLSKTVPDPGGTAVLPTPAPGEAIMPPPTPVTATGPFMRVETRIDNLRLRLEPSKDGTIRASLPDGHLVRAITGKVVNGFIEVETSFDGAMLRGFCSAKHLVLAPEAEEIPVVVPANEEPTTGIVKVFMPRPEGMVTKRTKMAGAHSLNEPGQPERKGDTPAELCASIAAIIDWLGVDKASHVRYQPEGNKTFCNIYAHDFCHLAGIYLPRVWWTGPALVALDSGEKLQPLIGKNILEMRANAIFHWLREFGPRFGWRQTGTLSKLQLAANQGAVCLIIARRTDNDAPGHVVMVVHETETQRAKRDSAGEVVAPVQSQAGVTNVRQSAISSQWWKAAKFAESAFWVHG